MERNTRKTFEGTVVSISGDKTIGVEVVTYKSHKLYGKKIKQTKKYPTHDEKNTAKVGDKVKIMETRPLSASKRWILVDILETSK